MWNSLPQKVVDANILSDLKKKLYIALGAKGILGEGNQDNEFDDQP